MIKYLREPGSGLTHLLGAALSVVALVLLLDHALSRQDVRGIVSFSVFGLSLVLLYAASATYHLVVSSPRVITRLRKLDHSMIYVLIAGTYTPVCLLVLNDALGIGLLVAAWSVAILGIGSRLCFSNIPRVVYTLAYVGMGLMALVAIRPLVVALSPAAVLWLMVGGGCYLLGALIYLFKKPNLIPKWLDFHVIFHLFVLLGSASHFIFVYRYC